MELVSNLPFNIRQYCGEINVAVLQSDREVCDSLLQKLDISGYSYTVNIISSGTISRRDFIDEINTNLDHCTCLIPVITDRFFEEENRIFRNLFWYQIGYLRALTDNGVVPFFCGSDSGMLALTPLKNANYAVTDDDVLQTLNTKYVGKLLKNNYYENIQLNCYASKRISFNRLTLRFRIFTDSFNRAKDILEDYSGYQFSEENFDKYIAKYLFCGCKMVSFGNDSDLIPQLVPYKDEMHPQITDYPKTLMGKRSFRLLQKAEQDKTGVRAEVTMELIIPVHRLFGVYIRMYLACTADDCPICMLMALMQQDFAPEGQSPKAPPSDDALFNPEYWRSEYPESTYMDETTGRLYFGLGFKQNKKSLKPNPSLCIGNELDYIYPQ